MSEAKQPFVTNLIQVLEGLPGMFGDERARVGPALASLEPSLRRWDEGIRAYAQQPTARHFAIGVLNLDRGRTLDAIAELTRAEATESGRSDIRRFRGLAYASESNAAAASDFLAAWRDDPQDPSTAYLYLFHRPAGDAPDGAREAAARIANFARQQSDGSSVVSPFARLSLLGEPPVAEPLFLPARYALAARELRARHFDAAVRAFHEAWAEDPLNVDSASMSAALLAGAVAFRNGRWTDAIAAFQSASEAYSGSSESRRLLGVAYGLADDSAKAVDSLKAAIAISPRDDRARVALADVLIADNQLAEAERVLAETVALIPSSGTAHWRLGRVLEELHRDADARREREAAVALAPVAGEGKALAAVSRAYLSESRFDKAEEFARARVAFDFNDAAAHEQLARIELQRGRDADALVEWQVASLLDPRGADSHAAIAQIELSAGRYPEAIEAARRALTRSPRNREARFALARALLQTGAEAEGRTELADAERLQADELESSRRVFATNLLRIDAARREQEGKWDEALALRRDVIAQPAAVGSDFARLGDALSKASRHDEAIAAYRIAIVRDPQPETYRSLIRECVAAGRQDDAAAVRVEYEQVKRQRFLESTGGR